MFDIKETYILYDMIYSISYVQRILQTLELLERHSNSFFIFICIGTQTHTFYYF